MKLLESLPFHLCLKLVILLALILAASGCASQQPPWKRQERRWYQSDMTDEERGFFLGTFFNGR